eukprot:4931168-Amphidinium_carterae.1
MLNKVLTTTRSAAFGFSERAGDSEYAVVKDEEAAKDLPAVFTGIGVSGFREAVSIAWTLIFLTTFNKVMTGHAWSFNNSSTLKLTEVIASRLVAPSALTNIELSKVLWRSVHCIEIRATMKWASTAFRLKSTAQFKE